MTSQRIVVTGASGLVGGRLVPYLEASGYEVTRLVRRPVHDPNESQWDPELGLIDASTLESVEAVVNLSGLSIAGKRWSEARRREIRQSRLDATSLLSGAIAGLERKPAVFISTSATGYYGDGGSGILTEHAANGTGFLAEVCQAWESAAAPTEHAGVRVVHPRLGIVVAREGGMLPQLKRLFGLGLGGRIGNGQQYMSWIDIDDVVRAISMMISDSTLSGPVNVVAPNPLTNRTFTHTLGKTLGRPTLMAAPEFAVRAVLGKMGEELVLASQRAVPERLLNGGFEFQAPTVESSLRRQFTSPARSISAPPVARVA